jgi:hypothetical protein
MAADPGRGGLRSGPMLHSDLKFHECTQVECSPGVWGARPLMSDTLDSER